MKDKDYQSTLVCDENGCYKLRDILQNPNNNCDSKECKELEEEYSKYMHLGIPVGYYHSATMFIPEDNYQERNKNDPASALVISEKAYISLIEPSIDNKNETKKSSNKITKNLENQKQIRKQQTKIKRNRKKKIKIHNEHNN